MAAVAFCCLLAAFSCSKNDGGNKDTVSVPDNETLYQAALLQSLMQGHYDGFITVGEARRHGDTGIGCFDRVNGELIAIDGTIWQALWDGTVQMANDTVTIPFCNLTFFEADITEEVTAIDSLAQLATVLNGMLPNKNRFYMARIEGTMQHIGVRSELAQEKPYRPLAEALVDDQREFDYDNLKGTIVALYCPSFMATLNTPGWHFHFISDDHTKGGHALRLKAGRLTVSLDETPGFFMDLPGGGSFGSLDLGRDMSDDIDKAEH